MQIVTTNTTYRILMDVAGSRHPIYHDVTVYQTGPVKLQEIVVSELESKVLHTATAFNWEEFVGKFPTEAKLIEEMTKHGINH